MGYDQGLFERGTLREESVERTTKKIYGGWMRRRLELNMGSMGAVNNGGKSLHREEGRGAISTRTEEGGAVAFGRRVWHIHFLETECMG